MKNKAVITILFLVLVTLILSGCTDFFTDSGTTTYQLHPTSARYTLLYGYTINCTGTGDYEIRYTCDLPDEIFNFQILSTEVHNDEYADRILATHNPMKIWTISSSLTEDYDLGITATVQAQSYLVPDLNGANALSIQEINDLYPELVEQYCQAQFNGTTVYIDPNDPGIIAIASNLLNNAGTNNSLLVAKELFKWLKQQTRYQTHIWDNSVRPACTTLENKAGDCDDLSFLYISLCRSIGIPSRFIRGFILDESEATLHAWAEVFVGGNIGDDGWIPVECAGSASNAEIEIHQNFGVEDVGHLRLFKDDGSNESLDISLSDFKYVTYNSRTINANFYAYVTDYAVLGSNQLVIDENGHREYT